MAAPTQSYLLDGVGDYITVGDHADFDAAAHLSLGCWISRDYDCNGKGATDAHILQREDWFAIKLTGGHRIDFQVSGAGHIRSTVPIPAEAITFVACVATESGADLIMEIYINGDLNITKTFATATLPAAAATDILIGCMNGPAVYFKGTISSVFMTNDRVTAAEVKTIFDHASGQATGNINALVIDIDTEGDVANAGTAGNGTATNAVPRTYMRLGQGQASRWLIPEAETLYNTFKNWRPNRIVWYGATIATGDELKITNWDDQVIVHWYGTEYVAQAGDIGKEWVFDSEELPIKGCKIVTVAHGLVQIDLA